MSSPDYSWIKLRDPVKNAKLKDHIKNCINGKNFKDVGLNKVKEIKKCSKHKMAVELNVKDPKHYYVIGVK